MHGEKIKLSKGVEREEKKNRFEATNEKSIF